MFEMFKEYIVVVVVLFCLCVGYVLKNIISSDKINKFIPLILGVIGIVFYIWYSDWQVTPMIVLAGFFSGLASTGLYEAFAQLIKKTSNLVDTNSLNENNPIYIDEPDTEYNETQTPEQNEVSDENNTNNDYKNTSMGFTGNLKC